MLSDVPITPRIEANVLAAFKELRRHRVAHGDIRSANIIVRDDESVVIVDFERAVVNAGDSMLAEERVKVKGILQFLKTKL